MEFSRELGKTFKVTSLIAFSILATLAVYVIVVEVLRRRLRVFSGYTDLENPFITRFLLYAVAASTVIIIRILRGILLKKGRDDNPKKLLAKLFRTSLITLFLCEVPALIGLVLFFIGGFIKDFYILLFVSVFLIFMFFPRRNQWEDWINTHASSPFPPSCGP